MIFKMTNYTILMNNTILLIITSWDETVVNNIHCESFKFYIVRQSLLSINVFKMPTFIAESIPV